ncbi:hypothetical protein B0F90DRAFT_1690866 [Multifurca ochricompacta]|uniref:Fe2OG dioxygenase domain-containing protein n=1 Tax=Multifurca ochricompacta TaxID=376703 RepID=A0AAD4QP67_9AGAM|nr:hypothetical protein B0F90DRAFT_1690866 [Multifurca ochricompacta]
MDGPEDTDTLLALLCSLLPDNVVPSQQALLEALLQAEGNVKIAAETLSKQRSSDSSKRKRHAGLDDWLTRSVSPHNVEGQSFLPSSATRAQSQLESESLNKKPRSGDGVFTIRRDSLPHSVASIPRLPPLMLSSPSLVAQHTPCTLHLGVLPSELASRLFYTMLYEAQDWSRNQWWLFGRLVESPHRSSLYIRHPVDGSNEASWQGITRAWYNGRQSETLKEFPSPMEEACRIIEKTVNVEMRKRRRSPLEWGGDPDDPDGQKFTWRANFAAANCYEGAKEGVGFHSDRLTSIGPYPTIASLSLGTRRVFRLREVIALDEIGQRTPKTFDITLPHNSLCIMHASTQECFKHSIPPRSTIDRFHPPHPPPADLPELASDPGNCRINVTFRFFRPDFHPDTIPRCKCGEMTTLRPDMKGRQRKVGGSVKERSESTGGDTMGYWWTCTAGDQNEGKGCGFWKVVDVKAEGRGPFVSDYNNKL